MRRAVVAFGMALLLAASPCVQAESPPKPPPPEDPTVFPRREGRDLLDVETPIGRIDYVAGRGLRLGKTGFTVGGFTTLGAEWLEGGESEASLEGVNFFVFFDPTSFLHVFSEIEVEQLATVESGESGVRSDPEVEVDRLYADLGRYDELNLRFGKFLTPFGIWNQAPAEPLVWTTSEPFIVEEVFDETSSGAMVWGSVFPHGHRLSYGVYGTFLDPIAPDREAPPADHSAGLRLEWAGPANWTLGASYFASEPSSRWNNLGGVDLLWRPHERVEVSAEALAGEGSRRNGGLWGLYVQGVFEVVPTLYVVGRYDRYDPPGRGSAIDAVDLGLTWVPAYYLRLKIDYRIADQHGDVASPGLRASFSLLF
jgi:hypothetical protein